MRRITLTFVIAAAAHLFGSFLLYVGMVWWTRNDPPIPEFELHPMLDFFINCFAFPFGAQSEGMVEIFRVQVLNACFWGAVIAFSVGAGFWLRRAWWLPP